MGFKDIIKEDLQTAFFNQEEFADTHMWGKKEIVAIVDDDDMMAKYSSEYEFLSKGSHLILAPMFCFSERPKMNSAIVFDKDLYVVNEVKEFDGMYAIFLDTNRG